MSEHVTQPGAPGRAGLVLHNLLFTAAVPGLGSVYGPATSSGRCVPGEFVNRQPVRAALAG